MHPKASATNIRRVQKLLRDPKERRETGTAVLEGTRAISGALDRGAEIIEAYIASTVEDSELITRLPDVHVVDNFARITDTKTPQPLVVVINRPQHFLDEIKKGVVLVAVDCNDPGNAGTLIRSAEAAGAVAVVFCGESCDPFGPKALRASAGAAFGIPVVEAAKLMEVAQQLRTQGLRLVGTAPDRGDSLYEADLTGDVAVFIGSEAHGLPGEIPVDAWVHIPMEKQTESLNAGVAGSIMAFEAARQRRAK